MLTLDLPSSKSLSHRAALLAVLSRRPCRVRGLLWGDDNAHTVAALGALGARVWRDGDDLCAAPVAELRAPGGPIDCGNSGTTLRLLTAQAARLGAPVRLDGDASLRSRPNDALLDALRALGARVQAGPRGRAPLEVQGPLHAGPARLPAGGSSQYASALVLALPLIPGDSTLRLDGPVASRPYLELTLQEAAAAGLQLHVTALGDGLQIEIPGGQRPDVAELQVEGDWSAAAFPLVAAALQGRPVRVRGLRADSAQGDRALMDLLPRFGPQLRFGPAGLELQPGPLMGAGEVHMGATPDLFPALCALAAAAPGLTRFVGAPGLRDKECDRIRAMVDGLRALGVDAAELPDGAELRGGRPWTAAQVRAHDDHRVRMAFSALGLVAPVEVDSPGCEAVSYPSFPAHLEALRAQP
jgi:3-phosphoshikimate 1-carboxyvinyltransferase